MSSTSGQHRSEPRLSDSQRDSLRECWLKKTKKKQTNIPKNHRGPKPAGVPSSEVRNEPIKASSCPQSFHSRDEGVSE